MPTRTIKKLFFSRIYGSKGFRLFIRGLCITISLSCTFWASAHINREEYRTAACIVLITIIFVLLEFVFGDKVAGMKFPLHTERLRAKTKGKVLDKDEELKQLINSLRNSLLGCNIDSVQGTIHLLVDIYSSTSEKISKAYIQILSYTGLHKGIQWRLSDISKGVIGRCFRTRKIECVNFRDSKEFYTRMISEFGFLEEDLKSISTSARSYMAIPLINSKDVFIGVIYLFSTEPQVFPKSTNKKTLDEISHKITGILDQLDIINS